MSQQQRTIQSRYNYAEAWQWLQQRGTEVYGSKFQLNEDDRATIYLLLCWFLQDDIAAPQLELDLQKGVLLTGPIGCGNNAHVPDEILCTKHLYHKTMQGHCI